MQTTTISPDLVGSDAGAATDQFLTFMLGAEEFGVDILRVQEIKGWERATELPNTPDYIRGVMNLRGTVVPIVDLRLRFGMESAEYTNTTVVIVLRIEDEATSRTMGFVVDAVSDVYNVAAADIQPAPDFGELVHTQALRGLAVIEDTMLILLDIDRLVALDTAFSAIDGLGAMPGHDNLSTETTE
jgi:purine-binding chemotaxis protein CheW